jgi:ribonuclease E
LIRTEAEGISEDLLIDDLENLLRQWEGIQTAAESASPPVLLNRDEDFVHRVLRDLYSPDVVRVVVDSADAVGRVQAFLGADQATLQVEHHSDYPDILEHFRVNAAIRDALKPRVDLPSGGYVIIEPTEALTVIDVNSGSFTRSANARETVLWTNCEAAVEIARQLKLRNIGGVVIVDFIDMESRRDQLQLLEHFTQAVRHDGARPQIAQLTELGLVELTRKRQGQNIYELFGRACPSCGGLGHVAVLPGKDTLQPLATLTGLVRSAASARAEVFTPGAAETGSSGRRRGGRGGRRAGSEGAEPYGAYGAETDGAEVQTSPSTAAASEPALSRRHDPDLVAVPMDADQEIVFGWMGLSPTLLLAEPPAGDNVMVRVVRPGEDAESVLEEARQQLAASGGRRRRGRGGRGGTGTDASSTEASYTESSATDALGSDSRSSDSRSSSSRSSDSRSSDAGSGRAYGRSRGESNQDFVTVPVEITPLPIQLEPETVHTVSVPTTTSIAPPEVELLPARRGGRTRSRGASAVVDSGAVINAVASSQAEAVVEPELDESGEPRRRRRRSSAAS